MTTRGQTLPTEPGVAVAVNQPFGAMLRPGADWASTQLDNCRTYLLSPTGRFQQWCMTAGIATVGGLTTDAVADFLGGVADRHHGAGLWPESVGLR
jgi:hypothetical protein